MLNRAERRAIANGRAFNASRVWYQTTYGGEYVYLSVRHIQTELEYSWREYTDSTVDQTLDSVWTMYVE